MNRTLKHSVRPLISFGVIFASITLLSLWSDFRHGMNPDSLTFAVVMLACYALIVAAIFSVRITVTEDGVRVTRWYCMSEFIKFSDVLHSRVQILAERDWPVSMSLRLNGGRTLTLGLKSVQQKDAQWLCSLPQLKCTTDPGLTRSA